MTGLLYSAIKKADTMTFMLYVKLLGRQTIALKAPLTMQLNWGGKKQDRFLFGQE
jgi:hypothetical protein